MMVKYRFKTAIAAFVLPALLLTACAGQTAPEGDREDSAELTPVTLTIAGTNISYSHALMGVVAIAAGFFEDEGLDVTMETSGGGSEAIQLLDAGQTEIVTAVPSVVMSGQQAGADVTGFYTLITGTQLYPAVPVDSDIQTYGDLAGRSVAVPSLASGIVPVTSMLAAAEGADPDSIEFLPIDSGAPMLQALESGQVDALAYFDTIYVSVEEQGIPLRRVVTEDPELEQTFSLVYAARSEWLEKNPETAAAFGRAMAKSFLFTQANPEAAARLTLDMHPILQSTAGDREESLDSGVRAIETRLSNSIPVDDLFGYATQDQVSMSILLNEEAGSVGPGLSPDDIWTDQFVAEFNEFDRTAIEELAKNFE